MDGTGDLLQIISAKVALSGMTQSKLAKRVGISESSLSRYLRGESDLAQSSFIALLDALGLDLSGYIHKKFLETMGYSSGEKSLGDHLEKVVSGLDPLAKKMALRALVGSIGTRLKKADSKSSLLFLKEYSSRINTLKREGI